MVFLAARKGLEWTAEDIIIVGISEGSLRQSRVYLFSYLFMPVLGSTHTSKKNKKRWLIRNVFKKSD